MELKLNKEKIITDEVILNTKQEQSIELDYVLPDYYPEIFKIVKCMTEPKITSYNVNGDKLCYDICVIIRILYCKEDSSDLNFIEQKLLYSKSVELSSRGENYTVKIVPTVDYINCRAINQRRIDVRGAISCEILVSVDKENEIISDAFGMDLELLKNPIHFISEKINSKKTFSVTDELELGMSKPSIDNIIWSEAFISSSEQKIIANKMVVKGEICTNFVYTYSNGDQNGIEQMVYTLPFSQIVELEGVDERFNCFVEAEIMSYEISPKTDSDGNLKLANYECEITVTAIGYKEATTEIAIDEFSSTYESSDEKCSYKIDLPPKSISSVNVVKASITNEDCDIDCIYCAKANIKKCRSLPNVTDNAIDVTGTIIYTVICKDSEGNKISIDKDEDFSYQISCSDIFENSTINLNIFPISCSYNLVSDNTVEIKTEIKSCGKIQNHTEVTALSEISVDEEAIKPKNNDVALKLYYASSDEKLWDIAKKYSAPLSIIANENNIDEDIKSDMMLIIPIM